MSDGIKDWHDRIDVCYAILDDHEIPHDYPFSGEQRGDLSMGDVSKVRGWAPEIAKIIQAAIKVLENAKDRDPAEKDQTAIPFNVYTRDGLVIQSKVRNQEDVRALVEQILSAGFSFPGLGGYIEWYPPSSILKCDWLACQETVSNAAAFEEAA